MKKKFLKIVSLILCMMLFSSFLSISASAVGGCLGTTACSCKGSGIQRCLTHNAKDGQACTYCGLRASDHWDCLGPCADYLEGKAGGMQPSWVHCTGQIRQDGTCTKQQEHITPCYTLLMDGTRCRGVIRPGETMCTNAANQFVVNG